jgi:long-chain acyl-CoA synthetase
VLVAHRLLEAVVLRRVRARIFGSRLRWMVSGGAPMSREVLDFFLGLGTPVLEGYGLTETSAPATLNRLADHRVGSVGRPLPGVSVRIADDGEVLVRGPGVFREYYRDPDATAAAFTADGWFRTGDVGVIDADGYLTITDRKKDLIITAGGKNVAPQNIENLLRSDPRLSQVLVHGDRRSYLVALITVEPDTTRAWLRAEGIGVPEDKPLSSEPAVVEMVRRLVSEKNAELARHEGVRDFRIVDEEFSIENGLLTPTLKLRRRDVERRYAALIDEMYPAV